MVNVFFDAGALCRWCSPSHAWGAEAEADWAVAQGTGGDAKVVERALCGLRRTSLAWLWLCVLC